MVQLTQWAYDCQTLTIPLSAFVPALGAIDSSLLPTRYPSAFASGPIFMHLSIDAIAANLFLLLHQLLCHLVTFLQLTFWSHGRMAMAAPSQMPESHRIASIMHKRSKYGSDNGKTRKRRRRE